MFVQDAEVTVRIGKTATRIGSHTHDSTRNAKCSDHLRSPSRTLRYNWTERERKPAGAQFTEGARDDDNNDDDDGQGHHAPRRTPESPLAPTQWYHV